MNLNDFCSLQIFVGSDGISYLRELSLFIVMNIKEHANIIYLVYMIIVLGTLYFDIFLLFLITSDRWLEEDFGAT